MKQITYVTGLWNLNREGRDFETWYIPAFIELLKMDIQLYIFGPKELEYTIWQYRDKKNTVFHLCELEDVKNFYSAHWDKTQQIRTSPDWCTQAEWLGNSPQFLLEYYNPIVMSKFSWLNDVTIYNPFGSKYFYWIDAGLPKTVGFAPGVLSRTGREPFLFLTYPHLTDTEIHGFERTAMAAYCNTDFVRYVCRGGFFGGNKYIINLMNGIYYALVKETLEAGYMGTEESIFTIMHHRHSDILHAYNLGGGGLQPYFTELESKPSVNSTHLYILTYNAPAQLEYLIGTMEEYDMSFLTDPKIFLIDNSDDEWRAANPALDESYQLIADQYKMERLKFNNIGITGAREYIAKHFDASEADFYFHFEDDMCFYLGKDPDQNGFNRRFRDLYETMLLIMRTEKFDFLKFNFQEVFAQNTTNTAWHNVSKKTRAKAWSIDENKLNRPPLTKFNHIKSVNGIPYADGDIFYANWPHVMSKRGSREIFINNTYLAPSENLVMAHAYELWMDGRLKSAVLLGSPILHHRRQDYDRSKRKEY